jgi:hypothetical protein
MRLDPLVIISQQSRLFLCASYRYAKFGSAINTQRCFHEIAEQVLSAACVENFASECVFLSGNPFSFRQES